ncbi:hypothetical protein AB1N83_008994 [Pleurotus pulmonarius]
MGRKTRSGLHTFLRLDSFDPKYKKILTLIHEVVERCFDPSFMPGKQPQDFWELFWKEINLVFPVRNDPGRKNAMRAHVARYIEDVRCRRRFPKTAKWFDIVKNPNFRRTASPQINSTPLSGSPLISTPQDSITPRCTASFLTLENISIISEEDLVPEYLAPRRCLVPPQPQEYQAYEICIVATSSVLPNFKSPTDLPAPLSSKTIKLESSTPSAPLEYKSFSPSYPYYEVDSVPGLSTKGPVTMDMETGCHGTELQVPLSYSPDVYNFLRSCVPETTHLIKLFVDELGINDLKSLFAIMKWPSASRDRYFFNLTRNGKLNYIDSDAIKRRLSDMQAELEIATPDTLEWINERVFHKDSMLVI